MCTVIASGEAAQLHAIVLAPLADTRVAVGAFLKECLHQQRANSNH